MGFFLYFWFLDLVMFGVGAAGLFVFDRSL